MATALVSLGSNVGDRAAAIRTALDRLAASGGVRVTASSSLHETKPAGGPQFQEKFLNAAALLETSLPPLEVLSVLQNIERELGRIRVERWGPRTIDLDLLLYDQLEMNTPELTLPHPRMSFRRFILEPAAEIASEMVYPINGWTIRELLSHLADSPRYIAIWWNPYLTLSFSDLRLRLNARLACGYAKQPDIQDSFYRAHDTDDEDEGKFLVQADYLANCAKVLRIAVDQSAGRWVVSDFWFDGLSVYYELDPHAFSQSINHRSLGEWSHWRELVPEPRLILVIRTDPRCLDQMWDRCRVDLGMSRERFDEGVHSRLEAETLLAAKCRRQDVGPALWLNASDPDAFVSEVLAAIAAME